MGYRLAADGMMIAHLLYIIFVVVGGLLVVRARWLLWLHVPAVAWAIYVQFVGRACPLTSWEKGLRDLAGESGYDGGFIDHYLMPVIYPDDMPVAMNMVLGTAVVLVNAAVYAKLLAGARKARQLK